MLGEERYLAAASKAAEFILNTLRKPDGELWHTYTAGVIKQDAYLDDYAFLVRGLLGLYAATGENQWLDSARTLTDKTLQLFWDNKNGGFYYTKADAKHLIVRTKKPYDSAIPSGNAVAVKNLLVLGADYRDYAEKTLRTFAKSMAQSPSSFMYMHFSLNHYLKSEADQDASEPSIVTATAKVKGKSDEVFNVELQIKIAAGWHINANPAGQDFLIPTTVALDANAPVEIVDIAYPKGKSMRFEFSEEPLNVYKESLTISLRLKQKPNVTHEKNAAITLKLTYQPCNDTECLFPQTLDIPLELP